jgi:coenzyme F420-0:L-glutamate ligase / coenzyme F420-1:gamma-L-glutamate ligase
MRADMLSEGAPEADIENRVATSLRRIDEAPVIILLCRDVIAVREHKREDEIMAIQSVANAATYLLLAAHAEGLGGNWLCWPLYAQEETRVALELPETWEPQAMVFVGYAAEEPKGKTVKPLGTLSLQRESLPNVSLLKYNEE